MKKYLAGGLVLAVIVSFIILTTSSAKADDVIDEVNITVPVSCSISGTGMDSHTATLPNGTYSGNYSGYTSGIGTTTLHAFCNDPDGLAIYATGFTGDEIGGTNSNKLVGSPSGIGNIETGLATSGNTSNWSMKLAIVSDTNDTVNNPLTIDSAPNTSGGANASFSSYHTVPNSYVKVAHKDASTSMDATTGGVKLSTTYAAYISPLQPAGTYTGKVKYTLVNPSSEEPAQPRTTQSGKICYYANSSQALGTMGCQDVAASVTSAILLASNFSREGYGFAGWSDAYDYKTNANAHFYGPQETISFTAGQYSSPNSGLSLYAVWIKSEGNLQDSTKVATLCGTGTGSLTQAPTNGTANLSSVSALTDQRDGETYAIAKLSDGNCWMIENLRLESTNSDNSTGALAQGYHSSFIGLSSSESADFSVSFTANDLYTTEENIQGKVTISGNFLGYRFPRYNNTNTSNRASNPAPTSNSSAMYSYGNYYTWHAAIADTTYYTSGDHGTTSICPTGWRLPIGNQSTADRSFGALSVALGGPAGGAAADDSSSTPTGAVMSGIFRSYPNNFLYSGSFSGSSTIVRGSGGQYWSSTARTRYESQNLYLRDIRVQPGTSYDYKYYGYSIRCVSGS